MVAASPVLARHIGGTVLCEGPGIALMPKSSVREELRIGSLRLIEIARLEAGHPVPRLRSALHTFFRCSARSRLAAPL